MSRNLARSTQIQQSPLKSPLSVPTVLYHSLVTYWISFDAKKCKGSLHLPGHRGFLIISRSQKLNIWTRVKRLRRCWWHSGTHTHTHTHTHTQRSLTFSGCNAFTCTIVSNGSHVIVWLQSKTVLFRAKVVCPTAKRNNVEILASVFCFGKVIPAKRTGEKSRNTGTYVRMCVCTWNY